MRMYGVDGSGGWWLVVIGGNEWFTGRLSGGIELLELLGLLD